MARMCKVRRARCAVCGALLQVRVTVFRDEMCAIHKTPDDNRITCAGSHEPPSKIELVEVEEYRLSLNDKRWIKNTQ